MTYFVSPTTCVHYMCIRTKRPATPEGCPPACTAITDLQNLLLGFQERTEVVHFILSQANLKPSVVEMNQHLNVLCCSGMEVRRTSGQASQDWRFELNNIANVAADHGPSLVPECFKDRKPCCGHQSGVNWQQHRLP